MTPAKILVVDDELELERLLKQRWRRKIRAGEIECVFARNGREALERLREDNSFSAIVTDLNMAELGGLELLEFLPEIDPTLKAIVVSASDDMRSIRMAMNRGAFDFLTKPIDFHDLEITVEKTLQQVKVLRDQQAQLNDALSQLRSQAFYDRLTGLANLSLLRQRLEARLHRWRQHPEESFALLHLDIDRYAIVKHGFGHALGDRLLVESARRLEQWAGKENLAARLGNSEFAVLLDHSDGPEAAKDTAGELRRVMEAPFYLNGFKVSSSASMGIAIGQTDFERAENVLRAADTAMHYAQKKARGTIVIFRRRMQERALERCQLEAELQEALENRQLSLYYQPIVSLHGKEASGEVVGFEALVRWRHPQRGWVPPSRFVPVAEETGQIVALGEWVLESACGQFRQWKQQLHGVAPYLDRIAVNLSGVQLWHPDLLPTVDRVLERTGLSGSHLKLEITETTLMAADAIEVLKALKARDIALAIDDFGTGYSSLAYIQHLPVDTLKIDRSFVRKIETDEKSIGIVQAVATLSRHLGLDTIVEGIETPAQIAAIQNFGCGCAQGNYFSPATDPEAIPALLACWGDRNGN